MRAGLYCFFATLYRYPDEEEWCFINDSAERAQACLVELEMSTGAFDEFVGALTGRTREEMEPLYVRTFLNGMPSVIAPPYESLYVADEERLGVLAAVKEFYERCGVDLSEEFHDMPDHISTELEFMHYLCVEQHTTPAFRPIIRASEQEFLSAHLLPFAQAMALALPDGLFHHASRALQSFVEEDLSRMNIAA
jgi:TorA maturation chaperone TorD